MKKVRRVYVPELDQVFETTKAAADALGVDAANIAKVLKGSRQTAGGYHFIDARPVSGKRRSRRQLRKEAEERGLREPDPLEDLRYDLKKALRAINSQAKRIKESGWGAFSGAVEDLLALSDDFGQTPSGYIQVSDRTISQMSEAEIKKYLQMIKERKKRRSYTIGGAMAEAERLAQTFGTTSSTLAIYADVLPFLFSAMNNAYGDDSEKVVQLAYEYMDDPASTPEDLIRALADLDEVYDKTSALTDMLKSDAHLLDQYAPIEDDLSELLTVYASRGTLDPDIAEDLEQEIGSISDIILRNIGASDPEAVNELLGDEIDTYLRGLGVRY